MRLLSFLLFFQIAALNLAFAQNETAIRVMTFNIRLDTPDDGINRWENRKDWVCNLIRHYDPGVFGLQEVLFNQLEDISSSLDEWAWIGQGREDGKKAGEFSPLFYRKDRWKLLESGTYWLAMDSDKPGATGWDAALPRIVTWAKLQDLSTGEKIWFLNTHFDHKGVTARQESALLILRKIEAVLHHEPVVLLGDFNSPPGSMPYQLIEGSAFSDSRSLSQSPPYGPEGTFNGFELGAYGPRIDYIFVNSFWKVLGYVAITDHLDKRHPSDHFPVLVELSLE